MWLLQAVWRALASFHSGETTESGLPRRRLPSQTRHRPGLSARPRASFPRCLAERSYHRVGIDLVGVRACVSPGRLSSPLHSYKTFPAPLSCSSPRILHSNPSFGVMVTATDQPAPPEISPHPCCLISSICHLRTADHTQGRIRPTSESLAGTAQRSAPTPSSSPWPPLLSRRTSPFTFSRHALLLSPHVRPRSPQPQ